MFRNITTFTFKQNTLQVQTFNASNSSWTEEAGIMEEAEIINGFEFLSQDFATETASLTASREGRKTPMVSDILKESTLMNITTKVK